MERFPAQQVRNWRKITGTGRRIALDVFNPEEAGAAKSMNGQTISAPGTVPIYTGANNVQSSTFDTPDITSALITADGDDGILRENQFNVVQLALNATAARELDCDSFGENGAVRDKLARDGTAVGNLLGASNFS